MSKFVTISKKHSSHAKSSDEKLVIEVQGGSPWFAYIWIDDKMYTLTKGERSVKIKKTTYPG